METAGYLASVFIGISLGLIGGGGSILTVPVLVYLFAVDAVLATTYSLFVVGTTSIAGSISYFRKGLISVKTALVFGLPSVLSVFLTRTYILPVIPQDIFSVGAFVVTKNIMLMLLFAVLMVFASYSMIKKGIQEGDGINNLPDYRLMLLQGLFVGMITGLIGAGGGFLIIPVLVNVLRLPMKTAVGTSLVIIAINSLSGFMFSMGNTPVKWSFLLTITAIAIGGILIGSFLSNKIDGKKLKPAFGWFVLLMGIYIMLKETIFK